MKNINNDLYLKEKRQIGLSITCCSCVNSRRKILSKS